MADSKDSDPNRQNYHHPNTSPRHDVRRSSYEDENPFIAFRRYADEQFSSLLQSVIGIPTTFSSPQTHGWLAFQNDPSSERYHQRHDRQQYGAEREGQEQDYNNASNHRGPSSNTSEGSGRPRFDEFDFPCPHHHHSLPFPSFFFDSLHDGPWPVDPFPFSRSFFHPDGPFSDFTDAASWPVPYILFSSYSPLHLERQRQLRGRNRHGLLSYVRSSLHISDEKNERFEPAWRDAFEDLIRVENGKEMLDRDSRDTAEREKESGGDWLAGLMERGSLGDQWKPVRGTNGSRNGIFRFHRVGSPEHDAEKQPRTADDKGENRKLSPEDIDELESFTELDLYDDFLRERNESSNRRDVDEFTMSPLLRLIFAEQERRREELEEQRRQWKRYRESSSYNRQVEESKPTETDKEEVSELPTTRKETGDGQSFNSWRTANSNTNTDAEFVASANSPSSRVVTSTSTSTERKTLPDGSIQTKVVRSTRFADGTEESNETVDVVNKPHQPDQTPQKPEEAAYPDAETDKAKKSSGWFWKE